ncbi:uncharacterized protein LOC121054238 [Oryza brachyantha]|uniref:uncharacterized protein LOC121054238 n=1 Tax=Oryza brachyantha TaxID=4533 RepID=UPI001AD9C8C1|nr:uncharacterized protein LOC121054238 [Oryza brachyantha]
MEPTVKKKAEPKLAPNDKTDGEDKDRPDQSISPDNRTVTVIIEDWRTPFIKFLTEEELPAKKAEAERVKRQSYCYLMSDGELLRRSASSILMHSVLPDEGKKILQSVHSGLCGNHASAKMLVRKIYRQCFFWLIAVTDRQELVRRCEGPFKWAPRGFTHLFVAIDKFTKWIEAKPVATIDSAHAKDFI